MSKTIVLDDATFASLLGALNTASGSSPSPSPAPSTSPTPAPAPSPSPHPQIPGYTRTIYIPLEWGPIGTGNVSVFTASHGGFTNGDLIVVYFTVPNKVQNGNTMLGRIAGAQYIDSAVGARTSKLSDAPGDLVGGFSGSDTVGAMFSVGVSVARNGVTYPVLNPGQTYYFSINNRDAHGVDTCAVGQSANMIIQLYKPPGL